jgi:hypothetical protein
MITWILAALIIGAASYVIFKKIRKMKSGDFTCEGCKGGSCSGCKTGAEDLQKNNKEL